jgi:hypothetical protein
VAIVNENLERYKAFVRARHRAWVAREHGDPPPWTSDKIVATRKFTNVFRILDRGSQYLYQIMRDEDYHTALFRAFLYRYTNRPEPWIAFEECWGYLPTHQDAVDGTLLATWMEFRHKQDMPMFGNAYKMFSGLENKGTDRLTWVVNLARDWITPEFVEEFRVVGFDQKYRASLLQQIPRCANFMSMQILTDMSYYAGYDENEFIIPGPGAVAGSRHIDPRVPADAMIRGLTKYWAEDGQVNLYGRAPSLMDVQNTLCEFSKYIKWKPGPANYKPVGAQQAPILPDHYECLI